MMQVAIFDLDNTLIAGDSDCLWGEFLTEKGVVDARHYAAEHEKYYQDYLQGKLDINEFLSFQLAELGKHDIDTLEQWREQFIDEKIKPVILEQAKVLVNQHREQDHELLIITATNRFLTEPIAKLFGIKHLIACEPEMIDGKYTGNATGTPSYAEGKVSRYHAWLEQQDIDTCESWFYSDSRNDIPLLQVVDHPVAVDPDDLLRQTAKNNHWQIITLRD